MKKSLLLGLCAAFLSCGSAFSVPIYQAPNGGNSDFYPLMQYQMEKQETLDFINDSENYKKKREKKDSIKETNFNPNYSQNYSETHLRTAQPAKMQFTKDENGNIKIQSIPSD